MPTLPMWVARLWGPVGTVMSLRSDDPLWFSAEFLAALRPNPHAVGSEASTALGHRPRPIEDTVRDIYDWFATHREQ